MRLAYTFLLLLLFKHHVCALALFFQWLRFVVVVLEEGERRKKIKFKEKCQSIKITRIRLMLTRQNNHYISSSRTEFITILLLLLLFGFFLVHCSMLICVQFSSSIVCCKHFWTMTVSNGREATRIQAIFYLFVYYLVCVPFFLRSKEIHNCVKTRKIVCFLLRLVCFPFS